MPNPNEEETYRRPPSALTSPASKSVSCGCFHPNGVTEAGCACPCHVELAGSEQDEPTSCDVAWCDSHGTGHRYDSVTDGGRIVRCHDAEVGYLTTAQSSPHGEVSVDLMALQTLDDGQLDAPELRLHASYARLTPALARQVAGWLTAAAERLEALR